jgi:hypothetical protein
MTIKPVSLPPLDALFTISNHLSSINQTLWEIRQAIEHQTAATTGLTEEMTTLTPYFRDISIALRCK